jgi:hypothetical protein
MDGRERPPALPGDVANPDPYAIAQHVARALTVPKGPRRFVRASVPLAVATQGAGQPVLGAPGRICNLSFCVDSLITVDAVHGGVGLLRLMDGNNQVIFELPLVVPAGFTLASQLVPLNDFDYGFAGGVLAQWSITAGAFTAGSISVMVVYESIPIGQRV